MADKRARQRALLKKAANAHQKAQAAQKAASQVSNPGKKRRNTRLTKLEEPTNGSDDAEVVQSAESASEDLYPEEQEEMDLDPFANQEEEMEEDQEGMVDELEEDELMGDESEDEKVSKKKEKIPERKVFSITYLVPKGSLTSRVHKSLELSSFTSWSTFLTRIGSTMGFDQSERSANDMLLTYQFSNSKASSPFRSLETRDEYEGMVSDFDHLFHTPSKRTKPLTIHIKSQIEPEKPKAVLSKKPVRKALSDDEDEGVEKTPTWAIRAKLEKKYTTCEAHPGVPCYTMNDGAHHLLSVGELAQWAVLIHEHKATIDDAPAQLKLTDRPTKPRGSQPGRSEALPAVTSAGGFDPTTFAAMLAGVSTVVAQAINPAHPAPPQPPALPLQPEPAPIPAALPEGIDYPTIQQWLESIVDTHPRLLAHLPVFTQHGLTRLDHVENTDLNVSLLVQMGIPFMEASAFIRMGRTTCREFRAAMNP